MYLAYSLNVAYSPNFVLANCNSFYLYVLLKFSSTKIFPCTHAYSKKDDHTLIENAGYLCCRSTVTYIILSNRTFGIKIHRTHDHALKL